MHPSLLAGLAALVAGSLWLASRRRPAAASALLDGQAVAALNRAQIGLVASAAAGGASDGTGSSSLGAGAPSALQPLPKGAAQRAALLRQLSQQLAGDAPQRLAAIDIADRLGGRVTLPLLQRGLRDVDPQVVLRAAQAMERFRGRTAATPFAVEVQPPSSRPLPRNVSRTR